MTRTLAALVLPAGLALAACATVPPPDESTCNAGRIAPWIGKAATAEVRAEIARATGAKAIRWLYPDSVVTMDYSPARLNVTMDKGSDVIRSARCG